MKVLDLLGMAFQDEPDDNQQFLEIGCGTGDFTRDCLLPRCPPCRKLVAGDVSRDMIEYAKQHFSHPKIEHDFVNIEGDVSEFASKHGTFRRVYSFFVFHWVKNWDAALKNISKLMTADGECLFVFFARHPVFSLRRELLRQEKWKPYEKVVEDVIPETHDLPNRGAMKSRMVNLLEAANLVPETCEVLRVDMNPLSLDVLTNKDLSTNPILPLLSEDDKLKLAEDVSQLFRSRWSVGGDKYQPPEPVDLLLVHARKRSK